MESEAKYTLVGTAVLALVTLIILTVLWFTRKDIGEQGKQYTIFFHEQDLSGLDESSPVTMRGIKIGSVKDLKISKKNIEHVRVTIITRPDAPIKVDAEAIIKRNLLTGLASIDLIKSSNNAALLSSVPAGERNPVIKEGKSELDRLASSVPDLLVKIESSISRINTLLSEENLKGTSDTIENVRTITESLAQSDHDIKRLIKSSADLIENGDKKFDKVAVSVTESIEKIAAIMKEFGNQGSATTKSMQASAAVIAQQIAELSQKVADAANNISATAVQYQDPRSIITGPSKDVLGPGETKH